MRCDNIHVLEADLERELYQKFRRYLKHIPARELRARYLALRRHLRDAEIAANEDKRLWDLPIGDYRAPTFWIRKELLTVEEFRLRGDPLPTDALVPVRTRHVMRPVSLNGKTPGGDEFLVKYGKCDHLIPMLERGAIRLSAARVFKEKENNEAQWDDELNKDDFSPGECVKITLVGTDQDLRVDGNLRYTKSIADYYLLCMSVDFCPDLITAFDGDGCVIIHNPNEFTSRLQKATRLVLPDRDFADFNVEYYDPYELEPGQRPHPVMSKALNFVYQKEHRFSWVSRCGDRPERHLDVEIGSLKDIAELVR
jgi:hypothetical protein